EDIEKSVDTVRSKWGRLDVLVNNAGALLKPKDDSLSGLRDVYNDLCNLHITSCALVTHAFTPLLHKSSNPKVINITSGLGSIQNTLTKKLGRYPPYGASKIGMNGASMHQQIIEVDCVKAEAEQRVKGNALIKFYIVTPGVLKTTFTGFTVGEDPKEGAECAVRLMLDREDRYAYTTNWEFEQGEMRVVPWEGIGKRGQMEAGSWCG
ncbi:MAG: hypothetical protein MMC23_008294, partial [Stictis urceolatum]|nr:hypothetical protein [Stictis urceolata]